MGSGPVNAAPKSQVDLIAERWTRLATKEVALAKELGLASMSEGEATAQVEVDLVNFGSVSLPTMGLFKGSAEVPELSQTQLGGLKQRLERLPTIKREAVGEKLLDYARELQQQDGFSTESGSITQQAMGVLEPLTTRPLNGKLLLMQGQLLGQLFRGREALTVLRRAENESLGGRDAATLGGAVKASAETLTHLIGEANSSTRRRLSQEYAELRERAEQSRLLDPDTLAGLVAAEMKAALDADEPGRVEAAFRHLKTAYGQRPGVKQQLEDFTERNRDCGGVAFIQMLVSRATDSSTKEVLATGVVGAAIGAAVGRVWGRGAGAAIGAKVGASVAELFLASVNVFRARRQIHEALVTGFNRQTPEDTFRDVVTLATTGWGTTGFRGAAKVGQVATAGTNALSTALGVGGVAGGTLGAASAVIAPFDRPTPGQYLEGKFQETVEQLWSDPRVTQRQGVIPQLPWVTSDRLFGLAPHTQSYAERDLFLRDLYGEQARPLGADVDHFLVSAQVANAVPVIGPVASGAMDVMYDGIAQPAYRLIRAPWVGFRQTAKSILNDWRQLFNDDLKGLYFGASFPSDPKVPFAADEPAVVAFLRAPDDTPSKP